MAEGEDWQDKMQVILKKRIKVAVRDLQILKVVLAGSHLERDKRSKKLKIL